MVSPWLQKLAFLLTSLLLNIPIVEWASAAATNRGRIIEQEIEDGRKTERLKVRITNRLQRTEVA